MNTFPHFSDVPTPVQPDSENKTSFWRFPTLPYVVNGTPDPLPSPPNDMAFDQALHCLCTICSIKFRGTPNPLPSAKIVNGPVLLLRVGTSIRLKWGWRRILCIVTSSSGPYLFSVILTLFSVVGFIYLLIKTVWRFVNRINIQLPSIHYRAIVCLNFYTDSNIQFIIDRPGKQSKNLIFLYWRTLITQH